MGDRVFRPEPETFHHNRIGRLFRRLSVFFGRPAVQPAPTRRQAGLSRTYRCSSDRNLLRQLVGLRHHRIAGCCRMLARDRLAVSIA